MTGPGRGRDRDGEGRPRSARPRDALGRPLARGAADAVAAGLAAADLPLPPARALRLAQRLLDDDRPFAAHEILEAVWKTAPDDERELWRGLVQLAVGITHARRGNAQGAVALLRRAGQRIGKYRAGAPHGIDAAGLAQQAEEVAARIEQDGLDWIGAGSPPVQLTRETG